MCGYKSLEAGIGSLARCLGVYGIENRGLVLSCIWYYIRAPGQGWKMTHQALQSQCGVMGSSVQV